MEPRRAREGSTDAVLLLMLYGLEAALLLMAIGVHGHGGAARLWALSSRGSRLFAGASVAAAIMAGALIWRARRSTAVDARTLSLTIAMNLFTVALGSASAEILLRATAKHSPQGTFVAGRLLLPRSWGEVAARNLELLQRNPSNISYFVPDDLLGWTIGPSRVSKDGNCASSAEGIRSPDPSTVYFGTRPRHRIALVGDSFTFGLEVPFSQSWGHILETRLGAGTQVLNFGVDGYGFDQAYLRFERDVRPCAPDVVVLGLIYHDLKRTMAVYNFIDFPEWGFPFSKPRLVVDNGALKPVNVPLAQPEQIFSKRSIDELPFLELDADYRRDEWNATRFDWSYVLRFLFSSYQSVPAVDPRNSPEAMRALAAEIVAAVARSSREDGATLLVVYFPSRSDFTNRRPEYLRELEDLFEAFRAKEVEFIDTTPCMTRLGAGEAFIPARPHYSPAGNAAAADCLLPIVREALATRDHSPRSRASKY